MTDYENDKPKEKSNIHSLIRGGVEIAGGAIGSALGFLAAGPVGAAMLGAGGAAAALVLRHIGQEASERLLGPREKVRVGAVLAIAAAEIQERLLNGDNVRADGFFTQSAEHRCDGEEIAESILLKSQREPEEKKILYMGHLLASVAFDASVSPRLTHQLIKAAEALTYRQLCIMKLAVEKSRYGLREPDYRGQKSFDRPLYQLLYECLDLYHRGFLNFGGEVLFGPTDVAPARMAVQGLGGDLYNLMRLAKIPQDDLESIAAELR